MNSSVNSFKAQQFLDFKDKNHFAESFAVIDELRQQRKFCDVDLKVKDKTLSAHRNILASTSTYFQELFNNNLADSQVREITIKEIEPCALETLINFLYRGEVRIDSENVRSLMIGASLLLLDRVRDACVDFLVAQLNPINALRTRSYAHSMDCIQLVAAADEYIRHNFSEVAMSEEFLELNFEDLMDIIECNDLIVNSEETTYEASMRWVRLNQEERVPLLPQLLSKVRLPLLSPRFLVDRVLKEDLIRRSWPCRDLVDEAIHSHLLPERREHFERSRARHGKIYAIGGENSIDDSVGSVEIYDPVTNKWQMGDQMSMARSAHGVAVLLGKFYVFGGHNAAVTLSAVEVFDPTVNKWSQCREMMSERRDAAVAVLDDLFYVCGGRNGLLSTLNNVDCFCPTAGTWKMAVPMLRARARCAAATLAGYMYVAGGWCFGCYMHSVEKYDPAQNSWIRVRPMTEFRSWLGLTTLNGRLYACGGINENGCLQSAEVYNPTEDLWKPISPMNCKRVGLALVENMGKLWAIGGFDGTSALSSVEVYDPVTDKWSFVVSMFVPRRSLSAVVIAN